MKGPLTYSDTNEHELFIHIFQNLNHQTLIQLIFRDLNYNCTCIHNDLKKKCISKSLHNNETTFNLLHTSARSISFKNQTRSKASQFFTYFKTSQTKCFHLC